VSKVIDIEYVLIRVPKTITVDGFTYPRNQRNLDVVAEYEKTQDESVLDRLVNFSLDI
jgi:hypothetical protein